MAIGRPPLPIKKYLDRLCAAIRQGATYKIAAQCAGISADTFLAWRTQMVDAEPGTALAELRERLELAEGEAAKKWLDYIDQAAAQGVWQAAAWKLERRYPQEYGRQQVDGQGLQISELLKTVLLEFQHHRLRQVTPEAEWTPMTPGTPPGLPAPPRPEDAAPPEKEAPQW